MFGRLFRRGEAKRDDLEADEVPLKPTKLSADQMQCLAGGMGEDQIEMRKAIEDSAKETNERE